jgi:hypothetical protein
VEQLNSAERGNNTLLQLLKLLETNKIGGIGGFDYKATLRLLKEKGIMVLDAERFQLQKTLEKISDAMKELKGEGLGKKELKIKVAEIIYTIVQKAMGTSVMDFYVRKAILLDDAYEDEEIGIFLSQGLQSDVRVLHGFLKNKSARRGINIAPAYFDDYDDFIDPIYLFLLLDFISDGVLDLDFVGECIGAEESFLTSDELQAPELEPVEVAETAEPSYQDSHADYQPPEQTHYEPSEPSGGGYGSDDSGGGGGDFDSGD